MPARLNLAAAALTLSLAVPAPAAMVRGEAGRSDGKAIGGTVEAWPLGVSREGAPAATAELDPAGRFVLDLAPGIWEVEVRPVGLVPARRVTPVIGAPVDLGAAVFEPTRPARLTIVAPSGEPVSGARVLTVTPGLRGDAVGAWRSLVQEAVSDAQGEVEAEVAAPERSFVAVAAAAGGYVGPYRERVVLAEATPVRLVGPRGEAVVGAKLGLLGWPPLATTDGEGRAVLLRELATAADGLVVELGGLPRRATPKPPEGAEPKRAEAGAPVVLALGEPRIVEARVVDSRDGQAIAGAFVWNEVGMWARSGGGGEVSLACDWESGLNVSAEGYLAGALSGGANPRREPEVVRLDRALGLRGRVVDRQGEAVRGAAVSFSPRPTGHPFGPPIRWSFPVPETRTDADGAFRIPVGADASGDLSVRAPGFAVWASQVGIGTEDPAPLEVVLDPSVELVGLVVDAAGEPVPGATVSVERVDRLAGEVWDARPTGAESGVDGRFVVAGLGPGEVAVRVESGTHAPLSIGKVTLPSGAPRLDLGTLVLDSGSPVQGRVVTADGQPQSGAHVLGQGEELTATRPPMVVTGADGSFRLDGFRAGERVAVRVQTPSVLTGETLFVAGEPPRDVVLQPSAGIEIVVEDPDGSPALDARIELRRSHEGSVGSTVTAGPRFSLDGLSAGEAVVVEASGAAGFAGPVAVEISGAEGRQEVRLRLEPRLALELRVRDADDLPVVGAVVRTGEERRPYRQLTGPDGRLLLLRGPGPVDLVISHPDYVAATRRIDFPAEGALVDVVLQRRDLDQGRIRGRVVDVAARGMVGARVRALAASGRRLGETVSGPDGRFELLVDDADPEAGELRLVAAVAGSATAELGPVERGALEGTEVTLEVRPGGEVLGRVVGLDSSRLGTAEVSATRLDDRHPGAFVSARVGAAGAFSLQGLSAGPWALWVELPDGMRHGPTRVEVGGDGDRLEVELRVEGGRRVAGIVRSGGEPMSGISVLLRCSTLHLSSQTGADGRFAFANAPEEPCKLRPSLAAASDAEVAEQGDVEVDFSLPRGGPLAGAVTDTLGTPIAGAVVEVFAAGDEECMAVLRQAASRDDGSFLVRDRPPGPLRLRAAAPGYGRGVVEVAPGEDGVVLALSPGSPGPDAPGCLP